MSDRPSGQAPSSAITLSGIRVAGATLDSVLGHIGRLGTEALNGWDAAATSLVEGDTVATYGATEERVKKVDQAQYDAGRGPCVDALGGEVQYFDGSNEEPRWRQFAEGAAEAEIYSVVSFPLKLDGETMGALNFYSSERDALRPGQQEEGNLFAAQAAVAISNVRAYEEKSKEVEQLSEGLQTRTLIGQATGLLMAQEGLTSDEAFQKLVKLSQTSNTKLRDIAAAFVKAWEDKAAAEKD